MTQLQTPPVTPLDTQAAPALGRRTVGSLGWMMANAGLTRFASFFAQVALGWILSENDFGIYALAISLSAIASLLKDAGLRQILIAEQSRYQQLLGPVFWMAMVFNSITGLLLGIAAPIAAWVYGEPALMLLVLLIAISQPLGTPGAILTARLQIDLRFQAISAIQVGAALMRYGGAVGFALAGFGPLSFVLPLPFIAAFEAITAWLCSREHPWLHRPALATWGELFLRGRWVLVASFGIAAKNLAPNLSIGLFAATAITGLYFFAFQIIIQIGMLFAASAVQVLFAALSKIAGEPERKRQAVMRSLRHIMLAGAPVCVGLAVTFPALELLVWRGKWADASPAVQWLGFFYAFSLLPSVAYSAQQAAGNFRGAALGMLALACCTVSAAGAGAAITQSVDGIALFVAAGGATASFLYVLIALRRFGISPRAVAGSTVPAWIIAIVAGAGALVVDGMASGMHPAVRMLLTGAACAGIYTVLVRVLLAAPMREALAFVPGPLRRPAAMMLLLGPGPAAAAAPPVPHG
jgi:O-antigen/teichoic acid export membrane protein